MHEDQQLIERAQAHPDHFADLYEKYVEKIFSFIYYRTGQDRQLAQDLTADTFTRALQALPKFEWQGYPYSTYLYTVARSVCAKYYKQKVTVDIDTLQIASDDDVSQNTSAEALLLWEHVATLPEDIQELLQLRFIRDLSYDDIAVIVGKNPGAIRTAISRAIKKIQLSYEQYE